MDRPNSRINMHFYPNFNNLYNRFKSTLVINKQTSEFAENIKTKFLIKNQNVVAITIISLYAVFII